MIRLAATLFLLDLGFAVLGPVALAHLQRTGEIPTTPFAFRDARHPGVTMVR